MLTRERERKAQNKYIRKQRKSPVYLILLFLLLLLYLAGAWYFQTHFFIGTTINKKICEWKTAEQVEEEMTNEAAAYVLKIQDADGNEYQLTGEDIGFVCHINGEPERIMEAQNIWLWPVCFFKEANYLLDVGYTCEEEKLETAVEELLSEQMGRHVSENEKDRIAVQIEKAFENRDSLIVIQ